MGNNKKNVTVEEYEKLVKKVEVISKLVQVCQSDGKQVRERVSNIEVTCELLKRNDVVLKEYSICYPDDEEEIEDRPQMDVKEHTTDEEIRLIERSKQENAKEIKNLEQRIKNLEDEKDSLMADSTANKEVGLKNTSD